MIAMAPSQYAGMRVRIARPGEFVPCLEPGEYVVHDGVVIVSPDDKEQIKAVPLAEPSLV